MKLLTNSDNVDGLKIVISAYEANVSLQIELQGEGILPCFIDEKYDLKLFVANSACLYLHENVGLLKKKAIGAVEGILRNFILMQQINFSMYYIFILFIYLLNLIVPDRNT